MRRPWSLIAACLVAAVLAAACGKKGNPLPPLRPVPARIADLTAVRTSGRVELRFTVPAANVDGTTPAAIDRVDIFRMVVEAEADAAPLPAGRLAADARNLRGSLSVRRPDPDGSTAAGPSASTVAPAPGEIATFVDDVDDIEQSGAVARYVAVPVAGTGRGRNGPPTPVTVVPLGPLPEPPPAVVLVHDETTLRATWDPTGEKQSFRVYRVPADRTAESELLTPTPVTTAELSLPVEFGREICLSVRALEATGSVAVAGAASEPTCLTPVDRYPPAAPTGLRSVQEGEAVRLIWDAVQAADLAGYVVLRGAPGDAVLTPLTNDPVRETTYRDATVTVGATYVYAVQAVDTAQPPNASAASARETVAVR